MTDNSRMDRVATRTPEQHAAVRRRALPVGVAGVVLGVAGVVVPLTVKVTAYMPPSLIAVNLAFCAMLMGAGILFYAKGTPGTRGAVWASGAALVLGMAGTAWFIVQVVGWRKAMEEQDLHNVAAIAQAAQRYAGEHEGTYPAELGVLLEGKYVEARALMSPYGGSGSEYLLKNNVSLTNTRAVAEHADYTYVGGGLRVPLDAEISRAVIVVYETEPVMRVRVSTAYADGHADFLTQEEFQAAARVSRATRLKEGLAMEKGGTDGPATGR